MIVRFSEIKKTAKALADEEQEIRNEIKEIMNNLETKVLVAGNYAAVITDRARKDLDKEKIQELLGDDYLDCVIKVSYQIFEVKKA